LIAPVSNVNTFLDSRFTGPKPKLSCKLRAVSQLPRAT
jgi:hypothetical protein